MASVRPGATLPEAAPPVVDVVRVVGLGRRFDGSPPVDALRSIDLRIGPGDYVSIVGPSGSGKSTLLNILGLLDRPTSGTYELDGTDVSSLPESGRTAVRGQRIGFVFQAFHLLPHRSVLENVAMAGIYDKVPVRRRTERARTALDRVGLEHRVDFAPTTLSGGERQRVAIARALAGEPALLLCDEPTGNLDSATTRALLNLFDELHDDGLALVVITHDPEVSARAARTVTMRDGVLGEPEHPA